MDPLPDPGKCSAMGNRIKELREARGLSMERLGEMIGTGPTTINKLEKSERKLHLRWMQAIAQALEVTPADLLDDADNPYRLTEAEREVIQLWRQTPPKERARLRRMLRAFLDDPTSSSAA